DKPAADPIRAQDDRFLIIGTGEFTWPPFLLAHALELAGHDVTMQATSRSPVRLGGAIGSALTFEDNYGTGVPNYLYNARREEGRRVIICHETPVGSIDPALVAALDAECLFFGVT
ncbi:phosphoribosyltransferase, partial [Sulfolobus sp. A20-N-F8]